MTGDAPRFPDKGWWLVVTVGKLGFQRTCWDSYVKTFYSLPDKSATEQFLSWWYGLSPESYTRKLATVHLHWCSEGGAELIAGEEMFPDTVSEFMEATREH